MAQQGINAANLSSYQQQELMKAMEEMQMKDSLSMYTKLVDRCFGSCVTSFRSKSLDKSETSCLEHCASRYLKMTQRVGLRFAEHQALQQKRATDAAAAAAAGGS
uniref:Mitochondrial import inner membrane translocase subunit n=1 Tax=Trieres chinensis TaxID=1514140 RepID=A0A7S1ZM00_TRICV|mmetsp:Transcript_28634/g.58628  ORF Transcript_28634/g.58628 Transcript_28634/m.58628 type:complete len:105 (+) Transcript_28634:180-494(+)|eukprot:CAMPEP_0183294180 /NCGR_PEP_ID=MMETSP0160_2-20130417/2616_1 /TAXON_ID=2839 ORGANISM="Odontella Sinensis, Strain Grunow 1884" /NCGR_SAMPLE_ID=MMETSP0160_2 /ASSEMBLY_ACC=CAM_ASM_000250 /LENGTH=104 /DNA_ID=CAMNT_0025455449 /DNA_START=14 /DNA_END=328 /DNA_ORIENTATION=-